MSVNNAVSGSRSKVTKAYANNSDPAALLNDGSSI